MTEYRTKNNIRVKAEQYQKGKEITGVHTVENMNVEEENEQVVCFTDFGVFPIYPGDWVIELVDTECRFVMQNDAFGVVFTPLDSATTTTRTVYAVECGNKNCHRRSMKNGKCISETWCPDYVSKKVGER